MPSFLLSSLLVAATASGAWAPPGAAVLQRYTLVIGANFGGADRPQLQYAVSDAERFARVMVELGGVAPANEIVLKQPRLRQLLDALDLLHARVSAARRGAGATGGRIEVVLYYSGHADEKGLLLGEDRLSYVSLRDRLDEIPADVRIAVLDACASGAFTRLKGGVSRPPFMVDESSSMHGHAFLTSSAETEAAQESDRIGASFFTYYLVSALRGAADLSGDGRVTLSEAYQFAFTETLGRTVGTRGGAQHPSYDINLTGSGDVVMTDMRQTAATLVLPEDLDGRVFIRNAARELIVELYKSAGRPVEIGLEAGAYDVHVEHDTTSRVAKTQIAAGARVTLDARQFGAAPREPTRLRGGPEVSRFALKGRSRFALTSGLWGSSGSIVVLGHRAFDVFGGGQFSHYVREDLAITAGLDIYGAESDVDIIGGAAIPITLQWNPVRRAPARLRLKPFLSAGLVPVTRSDALSAGRQWTLGAQFGAGTDVQVTPGFALGIRSAYNAVPAFRGSSTPNNYGGLQFSVSLSWLFGTSR